MAKEITAKQYAKIVGCTEQNITKHIRNNNWAFLPGVKRIKRYSRFVVLEVSESFAVPKRPYRTKTAK
jgi:hypothetical protein